MIYPGCAAVDRRMSWARKGNTMNPPTSFKEFATQLKLPTNMETAASTIGFNLRPIALRSMLDTVTLGRPVQRSRW